MDVMKAIEQDYLKTDLPKFNVGDTVWVHKDQRRFSRENSGL